MVTKHVREILETLATLKIDKNMFNKIVHISKDDEKHKYMNNNVPSIFIDDSYSERKKIKQVTGIPVFDLDSLECRIDWRY